MRGDKLDDQNYGVKRAAAAQEGRNPFHKEQYQDAQSLKARASS